MPESLLHGPDYGSGTPSQALSLTSERQEPALQLFEKRLHFPAVVVTICPTADLLPIRQYKPAQLGERLQRRQVAHLGAVEPEHLQVSDLSLIHI